MDSFKSIPLKNDDNQDNQKPVQLESVAGRVAVHCELKKIERKSIRLEVFDASRNLPKVECELPATKQEAKAEQRRLKLEKWKMEKEKKKREATALKKKPFIVRVAPNKVVSISPLRAIPSTSGRVTNSRTVQSNKLQKKQLSQNASSFAPKNTGLPNTHHLTQKQLKLDRKQTEKKVQSQNEMTIEPQKTVTITPYVTIARGKENALKEMKKKIKEGLLHDDYNDLESVEHLKNQLNSETKRITEMCNTWEKISMEGVVPDSVESAILGAVGQGRLLLSQLMQQFAGLVVCCEQVDPRHRLVTAADLHGFWDMIFTQIEDIDIRFKELEEMKARDWLEKEPQKVMLKRKMTTTPQEELRMCK
ncbi:unnamed protein product [Leptidea sinapis]|uniref:Guanylate kinase-associated protein mars n=1 Tax=Leptidea sinapis TaxID=189913 RepID=A0A5E4QMJ2_9NEOP|nr:unnamed protein product [Leptidea sinapis]